MKGKTYLMSFERMVRFMQDNGVAIDSRLMVSYPSTPSRLMCDGQTVVLSNDLFEKYLGTWWEVELADDEQQPARCYYLADSLQDALRLRPGIDTSYWCDFVGNPSQFISEIAAWQEDECFLE